MNIKLIKLAQETHARRVARLDKVKSQLSAMKIAFAADRLVQKHLTEVDTFLESVREDWKIHVKKLSDGELHSSPWFGNNQ